ncbi:MAG: hypothetical protein U0525_01440 [Patescibacteria group bacterium]
MKKEYAINTGSHDGKNVTITIVEHIDEVNFFDGGGKTILPTMTSKKSSGNQLLTFLTLVIFMVLCILGFITYISMGEDIWAFGKKTSDKNYVAQVAQNPAPLAAQDNTKPMNVDQPCYGFTLPYAVQKSSQRGQCSMYISLRDPKGSVAVDFRVKESSDVLPDITMRRSFSKKYEESRLTENGSTFIVFQNLEATGYEKTAFIEKDTSWIGITLKTEIMKDRDDEFKAMLRSFFCKNNCKLAN